MSQERTTRARFALAGLTAAAAALLGKDITKASAAAPSPNHGWAKPTNFTPLRSFDFSQPWTMEDLGRLVCTAISDLISDGTLR